MRPPQNQQQAHARDTWGVMHWIVLGLSITASILSGTNLMSSSTARTAVNAPQGCNLNRMTHITPEQVQCFQAYLADPEWKGPVHYNTIPYWHVDTEKTLEEAQRQQQSSSTKRPSLKTARCQPHASWTIREEEVACFRDHLKDPNWNGPVHYNTQPYPHVDMKKTLDAATPHNRKKSG